MSGCCDLRDALRNTHQSWGLPQVLPEFGRHPDSRPFPLVLAFVREHQHGRIVRHGLYLHNLLLMKVLVKKSDLRCARCGKIDAAPVVGETTGLPQGLTDVVNAQPDSPPASCISLPPRPKSFRRKTTLGIVVRKMVKRRTKGLQYALLSFEVTDDIAIHGCRWHRREKGE